MSASRIKELANTEKLEVAEITLQEARAQRSEIVYARWLDDVPRGTLEDPAPVRSSNDATQVNAPDHGDEAQATTHITASRIILSMAATKVNMKEQHCSSSVGCRNMTAWYGKHETNKCWRKIKNILMGKLVIGIPTTFVSENHGYVVVHRGIDFPSSGSVAASNVIERVRTAHFNTKIMPRIKPTQFDGGMTGKRNSCRAMERNRMEVKQQACQGHDVAVETEAGIKGDTDAGLEGDGKTTRHR